MQQWDKIKCGLLLKHLFQRKQQHGSWKNIESVTIFLWKLVSLSYHME